MKATRNRYEYDAVINNGSNLKKHVTHFCSAAYNTSRRILVPEADKLLCDKLEYLGFQLLRLFSPAMTLMCLMFHKSVFFRRLSRCSKHLARCNGFEVLSQTCHILSNRCSQNKENLGCQFCLYPVQSDCVQAIQ